MTPTFSHDRVRLHGAGHLHLPPDAPLGRLSGQETGVFSGTPEVASLKTDYVITATDGVFTASATISLTVTPTVTPESQPP